MGSIGNTSSAPLDFTSLSNQEAMNKISQLQQEMGQTGYEAGNPDTNPSSKLYVNSGKAWCINQYLNSDGKTYKSDMTDWDKYIDKQWVKNAINQIDKGMKPLSQDLKTYRYMTASALGKTLNIKVNDGNFDSFIQQLESNANGHYKEGLGTAFKDLLKNINYTHKAYTSTTYKPEHGSYDTHAVKMEIVAKKGTNAIVTANHKEHEILLGRNAKYKFTGKYKIESSKGGKKQLVLYVEI